MSNKLLCIYHGHCADGFGAAWAVREALGDQVEFYPGVYQREPPRELIADRHVLLVDFSYKRAVIESMVQSQKRADSGIIPLLLAKTVTILDHHQSAAEDLALYAANPEELEWTFSEFGAMCERDTRTPIRALFDLSRSGAVIAWDYFHPSTPPPQLLLHIQDRDLWRFKLPFTCEIQEWLFSYPYDFETWDRLIKLVDQPDKVYDAVIPEGRGIVRKKAKDIEELLTVSQAHRPKMMIGGYRVPVANLPYIFSSEAGHALVEGFVTQRLHTVEPPFAACYWDNGRNRVFSLRSSDSGVDVSKVASSYGGGGHHNAAGFDAPLGWMGDDTSVRYDLSKNEWFDFKSDDADKVITW